MIRSKRDGSLIVISGPTSAGKSTIREELLKNNKDIYFSVSMTTREPRLGEIDGADYFFISKEEFDKRINNDGFLEYAQVHREHYYGTPRDIVEKKLNEGIDVLLEIEIQGAVQVNKIIPKAIFIFIMPPDMRTLIKRLENRGTETKEKMIERVKTAYQEINEISTYNYVVVNDELDDAVKKVESIIVSEKCRVDRIDAIELDSKEEILHDLLMDK